MFTPRTSRLGASIYTRELIRLYDVETRYIGIWEGLVYFTEGSSNSSYLDPVVGKISRG